MTRTQTRIAALAAALAIPTGVAVGSIAFAQNATHALSAASATAPSDAPEREHIQAGAGNVESDGESAEGPEQADTPEPGDKPDAPASR